MCSTFRIMSALSAMQIPCCVAITGMVKERTGLGCRDDINLRFEGEWLLPIENVTYENDKGPILAWICIIPRNFKILNHCIPTLQIDLKCIDVR